MVIVPPLQISDPLADEWLYFILSTVSQHLVSNQIHAMVWVKKSYFSALQMQLYYTFFKSQNKEYNPGSLKFRTGFVTFVRVSSHCSSLACLFTYTYLYCFCSGPLNATWESFANIITLVFFIKPTYPFLYNCKWAYSSFAPCACFKAKVLNLLILEWTVQFGGHRTCCFVWNQIELMGLWRHLISTSSFSTWGINHVNSKSYIVDLN